MNPIPPKLAIEFQLTLDNLSLATLVATYLLNLHKRGITKIPTDVFLKIPDDPVHIPGVNCGFFTTPVINNALLDIRRLLEFYLIGFDKTNHSLISFTKSKKNDDFSLHSLGLPSLDVTRLSKLSFQLIGKAPDALLKDVYDYTNKGLAHYSTTSSLPDWSSVIDSTKLMKESLFIFVYDELRIPRPQVQPKPTKNES